MRIFAILILLFSSGTLLAQKSKYYGWWEHKGKLHSQDAEALDAIHDFSTKYNLNIVKLSPLAETEIQFYEDTFIIKYGISVQTGDGDSRDFKWFSSQSGVWRIDNNSNFKNHGKSFTIRENNFTIGEENWKDSIVNQTILFQSKNSDLIMLKFNNGTKASGVFTTQVAYPYVWFYLEYGFGNIYTKYY